MLKKLLDSKIKVLSAIFLLASLISSGSAFAAHNYEHGLQKYPKVTSDDLGAFKLSVHKFSSKEKLDLHHQHLLDQSLSTKLTPIQRYTYALLLGINHANNETRAMAIIALDKLIKDPSLDEKSKNDILSIRNLILYAATKTTGL